MVTQEESVTQTQLEYRSPGKVKIREHLQEIDLPLLARTVFASSVGPLKQTFRDPPPLEKTALDKLTGGSGLVLVSLMTSKVAPAELV
jgi:hypothetical protein